MGPRIDLAAASASEIVFYVVLYQARNIDVLARRFAFCKKYIACGGLKRLF